MRFVNSCGISPEFWFEDKSSASRTVIPPIWLGTFPSKPLSSVHAIKQAFLSQQEFCHGNNYLKNLTVKVVHIFSNAMHWTGRWSKQYFGRILCTGVHPWQLHTVIRTRTAGWNPTQVLVLWSCRQVDKNKNNMWGSDGQHLPSSLM